MTKEFQWSITTLLLSMALIMGCSREEPYQGDDIDFSTSVDTLLFDTVFTEVGSVTRRFKIYNPLAQAVALDISLVGGVGSPYRINADGITGPEINQVTIQAQDSLYVFAEVTIDPDQPLSISPFIVEDQILITAGSTSQVVQLEAFGQNANYVIGRDVSTQVNICTSLSNVTWDDPKPYVIYGFMGIVGCKLVLPPGTDIYIHGGLFFDDQDTITNIFNAGSIITLDGGSIESNGTADQPVTIQGDRLESGFEDVAGQYYGIRIGSGSATSTFKHTTIRNGIYGLLIDSAQQVIIENSQFLNSASVGIYADQAKTDITNTLIYSAGSYGLYYLYGGEHRMQYVTVASYNNQTEALRMQNYKCTDPLCLGEILTSPLTIDIDNSIFSGSSRDELLIDEFDGGDAFTLDFQFSNSIVRVDELLDSRPNFFDFCDPCISYNGSDTLFIDAPNYNYDLDSLSIAERMAAPIFGINTDVLGRMRSGGSPDIGCYESQFKQ